MKIEFHKYQGTGNDFIILDGRQGNPDPSRGQIRFLCDRHFGIGADGLMILKTSNSLDFSMNYFNSDGNESTMCGNGGRCMVAFARRLGIIGNETHFSAIDGEHTALFRTGESGEPVITLKMKDVDTDPGKDGHFFLDTGSPHYVIITKDVAMMDVVREARKIRYDTCFAEEGTNVDFVEIFPDHIFVRSYERGVEDETLSCGTGVTASAIAAALSGPGNLRNFRILTRGGELSVSFKRENSRFREIRLEGPATFVFSGIIEL